MTNPYSDLDATAFWRSGVADMDPVVPEGIYKKKWTIGREAKIGTAGSCFAQHIARHMRANGYSVMDVEPAPEGLPEDQRTRFGYSMYSGRYGNIYTVRQMLQLVEEAFGETAYPDLVWEKDGRVYDALRPNIEPEGFATLDALQQARAYHLQQLRHLFTTIDVFVFTMGLTEAWVHKASGRVVPIAPGIIAGADDAASYEFRNFTYAEIASDLRALVSLLHRHRKKRLRMILTVSPVPLTATASGRHVLAASTYSKAVLRAVAGHFHDNQPLIDYFPSFEIVTNPAARGRFFKPNLREVTPDGVEVVMRTFFAEHPPLGKTGTVTQDVLDEDVACEEILLDAFKA